MGTVQAKVDQVRKGAINEKDECNCAIQNGNDGLVIAEVSFLQYKQCLTAQTYHAEGANEHIWRSSICVHHLRDEVGSHPNDGDKTDCLENSNRLEGGGQGTLWTGHGDA